MISVRLSIASAIFILVTINTVMLGYLTSRTAYNSQIAESDLRQTKLLVNQTFHLVNQSNNIVSGTKAILTNQVLSILHQLNATTAQLHKAIQILNSNHSLVSAINITKNR